MIELSCSLYLQNNATELYKYYKTVLMKTIICLLLFFIGLTTNGQAQKNMEGEFVLEGVREMACVFKLNSDSSFEFYFSYGALDRYGSGKWTTDKNKIM